MSAALLTQLGSAEQLAGAQRLLADAYLQQVLQQLEAEATQAAIHGSSPELREESRHMVLAINRLRARIVAPLDRIRTGRPGPARSP